MLIETEKSTPKVTEDDLDSVDNEKQTTKSDMEDGSLPRIPELGIAQAHFVLQSTRHLLSEAQIKVKEDELLSEVIALEMLPYYKSHLVGTVYKNVDLSIEKELSEKNETKLKEMDEKIAETEKEQGETEQRDALQAKADYLSQIGDMKAALECYDKTLTKTVGSGHKLDVMFAKLRLGLFFMDHTVMKSVMEEANSLMEKEGDWDRRNRLKVYQGLYAMSIRDFTLAANLFLDTISTFTSYELMSYEQFIVYTIYVSMIALDRKQLTEKVVSDSEIVQVLHQGELGLQTQSFLTSLYGCQYGQFFTQLANVEQIMKLDRYLTNHYRYYVREMKCKGISQLLESYRSLSLKYMAEAFNVTDVYMDKQLSQLISDERLHCKIDKAKSIVVTNKPYDFKNEQYQTTIKQGDILLNRIQKLSRVINI